MHIAFFVSGFPRRSETFVADQITGLLDRGHEVTILTARREQAEELHDRYRPYLLLERTYSRQTEMRAGPRRFMTRAVLGASAFRRRPGPILRALDPFAYRWAALSLHVLDRVAHSATLPRFDVVHCHFGPNGDDAALLRELGAISCPIVTTFHGFDLRASGERHARLIRYCDQIHSTCNWSSERLRSFGFDDAKIVIHPPGVDVRRFAPAPKRENDGAVRLITVARLVRDKAIHLALRTIAAIRAARPDLAVRLRVVGDGPLRAALEAESSALGLTDTVTFSGPADHDEVRRALGESDLFLLPSVAETLSVAVLEAMACGLPVVATDVGGVSEIVSGRTGRLVPAGDPAALAAAVLDLVEAGDQWPALAAAARGLVVRDYDIDVLNERLVGHYRAIVAQSVAGVPA
jgi:colanic acid/amylovoran biosynthesis glycosyltransferase